MIRPLDGFRSRSQLTANRMWGIIMGMMEMTPKRNLKGILVRVLRYARNSASSVATMAEPRVKITVLRMISANAGSVYD